MKKVDVVYFGNLSSGVGPAKNCRLFIEYSKIYERYGITLSVYGKDKAYDGNYDVQKQKVSSDIKLRFKNKLNAIARNNYWLSILLVYRLYFYNAKVSMRKYLKLKRRTDLYFFQDMFSCYYYLKYRKSKNANIILMMRNNGDTYKMLLEYFPKLENTLFHKWLIKMENDLLSKIDKVGFVSQNAMNNFIKLHPQISESKTFFVHNGLPNLECPKFPLIKDKIKLVCAGAVNTRKGQDIIVEALKDLTVQERDQFEFIILGEGALLASLVEDCKKYNIDSVKFIGNVHNVQDYLKECHAYILCSRDEGLPMSIIEAMRFGKPIISTKVAGIPELVNSTNGVLINPDKDELTAVLKKIVQGKYDLREMGVHSRNRFLESFTIEKTIKNFSCVINSLKD